MENRVSRFTVIDAPSPLGVGPTGVERLPDALKRAGLLEGLNARYTGRVQPMPHNPNRDKETLMMNPRAIRDFSLLLADAATDVLGKRQFPVVLGGDCSILIGNLLALRRSSLRYGLFFIDGHADFYQPEASLNGEVSDMELALVSGRGPDILADIDNLRPYVRDKDVVVFGYRDEKQASGFGSNDVKDTGMHVFALERVKKSGIKSAASRAITELAKDELAGFWVHLDADVLDDAIMPAVDYRLEGGLSFSDLSELLKVVLASGRAIGLDITIFNPALDPGGSIARKFVSSIVAGLKG